MIDITKLSNVELAELLSQIVEEQDKRENEKKKELWNKVVDALKEYTKGGRAIEINDYGALSYITNEGNFSKVGRIVFGGE